MLGSTICCNVVFLSVWLCCFLFQINDLACQQILYHMFCFFYVFKNPAHSRHTTAQNFTWVYYVPSKSCITDVLSSTPLNSQVLAKLFTTSAVLISYLITILKFSKCLTTSNIWIAKHKEASYLKSAIWNFGKCLQVQIFWNSKPW